MARGPRDFRIGTRVQVLIAEAADGASKDGTIVGLPSATNGFQYWIHLDIPASGGKRAAYAPEGSIVRL